MIEIRRWFALLTTVAACAAQPKPAEPRPAPAPASHTTTTTTTSSTGGRVVVTTTDVTILDPVTFEPGKDVITATSFPALETMATTLHGNPTILLVEVQAHTDERGDASVNQRLTDARALAVVSYLIAKGVESTRLVAKGYGSTQPLDASHTEAAWAKNQRIAFVILKRSS